MELPLQNISTDLETWHRWLLFHYHCNECSQTEAACEYGILCAYGKLAFAHVRGCNRQSCSDPRCDLVKRILTHHHSCKEHSCPICAPVCKYQARSKSLPLPQPSETPAVEVPSPPRASVSHMPLIDPPSKGIRYPMQISAPVELTPKTCDTGGSIDVSKNPASSFRGASSPVMASGPSTSVTATMQMLPDGGLFAARQRELDRRMSCQAALLRTSVLSPSLPGSGPLDLPCGATSPSSPPAGNMRSKSMEGRKESIERSCSSSSSKQHPPGPDYISHCNDDELLRQQQQRNQHHHHLAEAPGSKGKPGTEQGDAAHTAPQCEFLESAPASNAQPLPHTASGLAWSSTTPFATMAVQLHAQGHTRAQYAHQQSGIPQVKNAVHAAYGQQSVPPTEQVPGNQQLELCANAVAYAAHSPPQGPQPYFSTAFGPMGLMTSAAPPLQITHPGASSPAGSLPGGLMHTLLSHQTALLAHNSSALPPFAMSYPLHGVAHDVYGIGPVAFPAAMPVGCGPLPVDGGAGGVAASISSAWLACLPSSGHQAVFLQTQPPSAVPQQPASELSQACADEPVGAAPLLLPVVGTT